MAKKLKVTLVRSINGRMKNQIACVKGLGLKHINQTVEVENTPAIRGMIDKVGFLLKVEEV